MYLLFLSQPPSPPICSPALIIMPSIVKPNQVNNTPSSCWPIISIIGGTTLQIPTYYYYRGSVSTLLNLTEKWKLRQKFCKRTSKVSLPLWVKLQKLFPLKHIWEFSVRFPWIRHISIQMVKQWVYSTSGQRRIFSFNPI